MEVDGEIAHLLLTGLVEAPNVGRGPGGALGGVLDEMRDDVRIGQLLRQYRSDADGQGNLGAFLVQVRDRVEERNIGLRDRLVNPFLPVRPHARLPRVWNMTVQNERKCAGCCHGHPLWLCRSVGCGR
jgi:hypothetical protein